ncbi:SurA N-terminal domain-containing protein [Candidatus Gottesmanbacteria bacterium]|nr:SurA N-terminal domain-containing protein [Candidatus Gottesmanbacteria bacterium]
MPRKKSVKQEILSPTVQSAEVVSPLQKLRQKRTPILLALLLVILALIYFKTNLINIVTVDGNPITRWELEKELNTKFADQTLDTLISEKIILNQAKKEGITVNQNEIDNRIAEIEKRLQGQLTLEDALKAQGLNQDSFRKQIEIQLVIDKMFTKDATVSQAEIDEYISQNQDFLTSSTEPAKLREDVYETLKQQKIGDLFDKWFTEIRQKVNIVKQ